MFENPSDAELARLLEDVRTIAVVGARLPTYATLAEIPRPIDMVDVFRAAEHLAAVVEEALALSPLPKAIWAQLGVVDDDAAARAAAEGVIMVMDRCPAIEIPRLAI